MPKLRVGVLFGGRSGEHEVSLMSAQSIMDAIDRDKYEVVPIHITKAGKWILSPREGTSNVEEFKVIPDPTIDQGLDVVFPVLHGTYGEDGTIQGLLELANIPYVGAGVLASAAAMDKAVMRNLFQQAGLPLVPWQTVIHYEWNNNPDLVRERIKTHLGFPCFVKPANLGSSVGVSKVTNESELDSAMAEAFAYDRKAVVEQGVLNAREIECSVLGNNHPQISIPGEIIPANDFYDYEAKYHNDKSQLIIPAKLSADQIELIQKYARMAFQAVDCAGMGRVDFFLTSQGEIIVNEINTIPGFTKISMYPKLWEASGLPYPELINRLIVLALERSQERWKLRTSRD